MEVDMTGKICILIECDNNKKIFTHKKNLNYILEFVNKFKLKIHYAKTEQQNIVYLEDIARVYCDQSYQSPEEYQIIRKNILKNPDKRISITTKAREIREQIKTSILKKGSITFKEIQEKFEKENISISSLCNHFKQVRTELAQNGVKVEKIKNGVYKIK